MARGIAPGQRGLRDYRSRERITQAELARRLGVSPATVSLWLRGLRTPERRFAVVIERVTGVPVEVW